MATQFRVIDLRTNTIDAIDIIVQDVRSPEEAAEQVLGIRVVRTGSTKDLVARVYWQKLGHPVAMVRLYKVGDGSQPST